MTYPSKVVQLLNLKFFIRSCKSSNLPKLSIGLMTGENKNKKSVPTDEVETLCS